MTIERPVFPPRAESVDSSSPPTATNHGADGQPTSDSPTPVQELLPSATVLKMRPRAINPPVKTTGAEGLSPWKAGSKREAASDVIKAAVTYCCAKSTAEAGFISDHTRDGVFAGCVGIVGEKYSRDAERSMRKLVKLMDGASGLMTVELRSLASVAGFVIKQIEQLEVDPNDDEMDFLKSFAGLVERFCGDQYDREIKAEPRS
jgi:hypothetical protein